MNRTRALAFAFVLLSLSCAPRNGGGAISPASASNGASSSGGESAPNDAAAESGDTSGGDGSIAAPDATHVQRGMATWYGAAFAGKPTASGERFDPDAMTAAHRKLRFGTWVEVCRQDDAARCVRVRINDRGPFGHADRVIDLSKHAAQMLGILRDGSGAVTLRVVDGP